METAVFKSYSNGLYTFIFNNGSDCVFDEILQKVLSKYDLKNDSSFVGKEFQLRFSEVMVDINQDLVIYRIENLKLI